MNRTRLASLAVLCGGALWGLYWLPIRRIEAAGLVGDTPAAAVFATVFILAVPLLIIRRKNLTKNLKTLAISGALAGGALGLYSASLGHTDIVRATLLFYLTPVWSSILGVIFLFEKITVGRVSILALGLVGLLIVMGASESEAKIQGDLMALVSGILWSFGSLYLFRMPKTAPIDLVLSMIVGSSVLTVGLAVFSSPFPQQAALASALPWIGFTALYIFPMIALTLWPTTVLPPAKVGVLLLSEVLVGVSSAALFSGEPFGQREIIGSLLIVSALLAEVLGSKSNPPV